jgi:hypothetical protein
MAKVDLGAARDILNRAIVDAKASPGTEASRYRKEINSVIAGTHLTYRYMLVTGLLGRAAGEGVNPLAVQVHSDLNGAYDARSLCHKVVVPAERAELEARLGGSNEPYLNKPARVKELSLDNPVRRGSDTETLKTVIKILSRLGREEAYQCLTDAMRACLMREGRHASVSSASGGKGIGGGEAARFYDRVTHKSIEGETTSIMAGLALKRLASVDTRKLQASIHPVNESGASSNQVSDIDVVGAGAEVVLTVEVKDKKFTREDVEHAVIRAMEAGLSHLIFVLGPRGTANGSTTEDMVDHWEARGFNLVFLDLRDLFKLLFAIAHDLSREQLGHMLTDLLKESRAKDETVSHIDSCIRAMGWKT